MTTQGISLPTLVEALTALRAVVDAGAEAVPIPVWRQSMRALYKLESDMHMSRIVVPVAQSEQEPA